MKSYLDYLEPDSLLQFRLVRLSKYLAVVVLMIGVLALTSRQWDLGFSSWLVSPLNTMNALTGISFILTAFSFLLLSSSRVVVLPRAFSGLPAKVLGRALAVALLLISLLQVILKMKGAYSIDHFPGSMTWMAVVCFMLTGASLLSLNTETKSPWMPAHFMAVAIGMLSLFSLVSHLYGVQASYGPLHYAPMAMQTTIGFMLFSISVLSANPGKGIMQGFTGKGTGSLMARRLLPLVVLLPIILGYLRLKGYRKGLFVAEIVAMAMVLSLVFVFVNIIWYYTYLLNKKDARISEAGTRLLETEDRFRTSVNQRQEREQQLRQLNNELEERIRLKTSELTAIFEPIDEAFITVDKDLCYTYLNRSACELMHTGAASLIGKRVADVFPGANGTAVRHAMDTTMTEQKNNFVTEYDADLDRWLEYKIYLSPEGLSLFIRDITERKKKETELSLVNELLERSYHDSRQLPARLQDAREEERAGIAREIHDELGQQLTGIKMNLSWILKRMPAPEGHEVKQKVNRTLDLLDTTISTVRRIATELRPNLLFDLGLIAAIQWQTEEFQKRSGIPTKFVSTLPESKGSFSTAIGLFRICQESLTNIARHAEADNVNITLQEIEGKSILLKIQDDGKGFHTDNIARRKTLGLMGMEERTLMMGGYFGLSSAPGAGTVLTVIVPLNINLT